MGKREYERVETTFKRFEKIGQSVEGELLDVDINTSEDFKIYTVKDDKGIVSQFHDSTQSKDLLNQCQIGDYIVLTFVSTQNLPNGELKIFTLDRSK